MSATWTKCRKAGWNCTLVQRVCKSTGCTPTCEFFRNSYLYLLAFREERQHLPRFKCQLDRGDYSIVVMKACLRILQTKRLRFSQISLTKGKRICSQHYWFELWTDISQNWILYCGWLILLLHSDHNVGDAVTCISCLPAFGLPFQFLVNSTMRHLLNVYHATQYTQPHLHPLHILECEPLVSQIRRQFVLIMKLGKLTRNHPPFSSYL